MSARRAEIYYAETIMPAAAAQAVYAWRRRAAHNILVAAARRGGRNRLARRTKAWQAGTLPNVLAFNGFAPWMAGRAASAPSPTMKEYRTG
jgi:hypothetical protein